MQAKTLRDDPPTLQQQPGGAPGSGSRERGAIGRTLLLVGVAALLIAAAGLALVLLVFSPGSGSEDEYRAKVNSAMREVVSSNRSVSAALARLGTGKSTSAERAVARAQNATASARGAVNALTVPEGEEPFASNARQTLSREAAYLSAVSGILRDPAAPGAERAETLATNLTDALDVLAPTDADWSQSVGGSDNLSAWARRNTLRVERTAAARRRRVRTEPQVEPQSGGGIPNVTRVPPASPPSGVDCGGGLRAGPNTSCAFAANVRAAWQDAPGTTNTMQVYSPTTGRSYTMNCAPAGSGTTCSGGNNASVSF